MERVLVACCPEMTQKNYLTVPKIIKRMQREIEKNLRMMQTQTQAETENGGEEEETRRVVVMPEYIGTWMIATNQPRLCEAKTMESAMLRLVLEKPCQFIKWMWRSFWRSKKRFGLMGHVRRALFLMEGQMIFGVYCDVFSHLALANKAWIVGGSVLIPRLDQETIPDNEGRPKEEVKIEENRDNAFLHNGCVVFGPDGLLYGVRYKRMLVPDEEKFLDEANDEMVAEWGQRSFELEGIGLMDVLICADSWFPSSYKAPSVVSDLLSRNPSFSDLPYILAVPSFCTPASGWNSPWQGYCSGHKVPDDVDQADVGVIAESSAWRKYALSSRILQYSGLRCFGINTFFRGRVWDVDAQGDSLICDSTGAIFPCERCDSSAQYTSTKSPPAQSGFRGSDVT